MTNPELLPPGFRFHPTDEELILHYLKNRAASLPCPVSIIAEVDIYKFDPWDLPAKAAFGDREWYFFSPRDRKYPNGVRPNRAAGSGYWKATGTDKPIATMRSGKSESIGVKKALVFYTGKPPKGRKTNWIMHEYRLADTSNANSNIHLRYSPPLKQKEASMRLDDWVLCRIYEKTRGNHEGPPPAEDHSKMESSYSLVSPFTDLGGLQNRVQQQQGEVFVESDYNVLSRLLQNPPDMAGQDQLLPQFRRLGPAVNHPPPLFHGSSCSSGFYLERGPQPVEPPVPLMGGSGCLKRQRVSGTSAEEGHGTYPNLKGLRSNMPSFMDPLDPSQANAINQAYLLNSHFGFQ